MPWLCNWKSGSASKETTCSKIMLLSGTIVYTVLEPVYSDYIGIFDYLQFSTFWLSKVKWCISFDLQKYTKKNIIIVFSILNLQHAQTCT